MRVNNAFDYLVNKQGQTFTLEDASTGNTYTIKAAPSNFSRDFQAPEEVTIKGREYVLSISNLTLAGFTDPIKKNDKLVDPDDSYSYRTIEEVKELLVLGNLVGYRVRTN